MVGTFGEEGTYLDEEGAVEKAFGCGERHWAVERARMFLRRVRGGECTGGRMRGKVS